MENNELPPGAADLKEQISKLDLWLSENRSAPHWDEISDWLFAVGNMPRLSHDMLEVLKKDFSVENGDFTSFDPARVTLEQAARVDNTYNDVANRSHEVSDQALYFASAPIPDEAKKLIADTWNALNAEENYSAWSNSWKQTLESLNAIDAYRQSTPDAGIDDDLVADMEREFASLLTPAGDNPGDALDNASPPEEETPAPAQGWRQRLRKFFSRSGPAAPAPDASEDLAAVDEALNTEIVLHNRLNKFEKDTNVLKDVAKRFVQRLNKTGLLNDNYREVHGLSPEGARLISDTAQALLVETARINQEYDSLKNSPGLTPEVVERLDTLMNSLTDDENMSHLFSNMSRILDRSQELGEPPVSLADLPEPPPPAAPTLRQRVSARASALLSKLRGNRDNTAAPGAQDEDRTRTAIEDQIETLRRIVQDGRINGRPLTAQQATHINNLVQTLAEENEEPGISFETAQPDPADAQALDQNAWERLSEEQRYFKEWMEAFYRTSFAPSNINKSLIQQLNDTYGISGRDPSSFSLVAREKGNKTHFKLSQTQDTARGVINHGITYKGRRSDFGPEQAYDMAKMIALSTDDSLTVTLKGSAEQKYLLAMAIQHLNATRAPDKQIRVTGFDLGSPRVAKRLPPDKQAEVKGRWDAFINMQPAMPAYKEPEASGTAQAAAPPIDLTPDENVMRDIPVDNDGGTPPPPAGPTPSAGPTPPPGGGGPLPPLDLGAAEEPAPAAPIVAAAPPAPPVPPAASVASILPPEVYDFAEAVVIRKGRATEKALREILNDAAYTGPLEQGLDELKTRLDAKGITGLNPAGNRRIVLQRDFSHLAGGAARTPAAGAASRRRAGSAADGPAAATPA